MRRLQVAAVAVASLGALVFGVEGTPVGGSNPTWWLWPNINSTAGPDGFQSGRYPWQKPQKYPWGPGPGPLPWGQPGYGHQQWASGSYARPPHPYRPSGHYGGPFPDYGHYYQGPYPGVPPHNLPPPYWPPPPVPATSPPTTTTTPTPTTTTTAATTTTTAAATTSTSTTASTTTTITTTSTATTAPTTPNRYNCTCVPFYLCREADVVSDGTAAYVGHHHHQHHYARPVVNACMYVVQVCCRFPLPTPAPATTSTASPRPPNATAPAAPCGLADGARLPPWSDGFVQPRIIGPDSATRFGEAPWMAAVLEDVGHPSSLGFVCGGTLVGARVVLTAAHCVAGKAAVNLRVRLGEWNWKTQLDGPIPPQQFNVQNVVIHPQYSPVPNTAGVTTGNSTLGTAYRNDVALLILRGNATLSSYIAVICLPNGTRNATPYDPLSCTATGWGVSNPWSHELSHSLKKVQVAVLENNTCTQALNFSLDNSSLCAGGQKHRDACLGDGGGPLYCRMTNVTAGMNRYILIGIISWGIGKCGTYGNPGIYANITALAPWINQVIQNSTRPANSTTTTSTTSTTASTTSTTTRITTLGPPIVIPHYPHYDDHDYFSYG